MLASEAIAAAPLVLYPVGRIVKTQGGAGGCGQQPPLIREHVLRKSSYADKLAVAQRSLPSKYCGLGARAALRLGPGLSI